MPRGKNRDCQRKSGPSLLEVRCRQHSHGMQPTMSTDDALYTNAALPRISGLAFVTGDIAEMLKMQHIFAYNGLPYRATGPKRGRRHIRHTYVPLFKISRRSVPPSPRYRADRDNPQSYSWVILTRGLGWVGSNMTKVLYFSMELIRSGMRTGMLSQ